MGAGKRLNYYVEKQGLTKKKFCENFAFEYNNMTSIMSEKRVLGINILNQIHFAFPKLNIHWLLYGEGSEEIGDNEMYILNEPVEMYVKDSDAFEFILLKYLDSDKIKNKIYEIIKEKVG